MHSPGHLHMSVHKNSRPRALRLVQALADEGSRRGYDVHEITHHGCTGGLEEFAATEVASSIERRRSASGESGTGTPVVQPPSPDDLRRFLGGLNPFGPNLGW